MSQDRSKAGPERFSDPMPIQTDREFFNEIG